MSPAFKIACRVCGATANVGWRESWRCPKDPNHPTHVKEK